MAKEEYSEIEIKPDSVIKPLGDCCFDIDGRVVEFRIRKLTPTECFRLMDVRDEQTAKLLRKGDDGKQVVSNSQMYKMAGNSIVVACLEHIFEEIFYPSGDAVATKQMTLF